MGIPVIIVPSGGLPVTISTNGYGLPMTISTNGYGLPITQAVAGYGLPVVGVSFGPTIDLSAFSVLETAPINTTVGTLSLTPGTTGTPAYSLVDSAGGKFNILGTALRTNALLDYETAMAHSITIAVSGVTPTVPNRTLPIIVINVVEPEIALSAATVNENATIGVNIGTLSLVNAYTGTPAYSLVDSAGGKVAISGVLLNVAGAIDYETTPTFNITVAVSGVTPAAANKVFTITVFDVASPTAPVLDLTTDETDTTPDFTLTGDLVLGDTVRFQYSTSAVFSGASELTNTIDAAEDAANAITFTTGALTPSTWYFRARIERASEVGAWSNTETITFTSTTSAEVTQFLARTTGLDGTHTAAYTALIDGLVADGLWAKIDALYIFATQSTANALLNLKSSSYTPTIVGTLTFTADDGYTFASGSNYINTSFNASTAGGVYQRDNAHMSVWMFNDNGSMGSVVGTLSGTTQQRIMPRLGGTAYYRLHIVDPDDCNLARATGAGWSIAIRISSTVLGGYLNGAVSPFASATANSVAPNNSNFTFPDIASGEQDTGNIVSGGSFGSQMSAAEQNSFYNRLRAYMTAVGVP